MCTCTTPYNYNGCTCTVSAVDTVYNDIYLTTEELNTLKSQLELKYAQNESWFKQNRFGIIDNSKSYRKDLLLLIIFFTYWNQNSDGTTTGFLNYVSRSEFSQAVAKAKLMVGATIIT